MYKHLPAAALLALASMAAHAQTPPRPIVVELFTSQGCSSCPPADRILSELARTRTDVLPLAFHVTYWNQLGWRDPYSLDLATDRQRSYAAISNVGGIYTPQAVVDGTADVVGSEYHSLRTAIADAARHAIAIPLAATRAGNDITIGLGAAKGSGRVLLIGYDKEHATPVPRGENAGATLVESNIVRTLTVIGNYDGAPLDLHIQAPAGDALAVIVQAPDGKILGAARVTAAAS